MVQTPTPQVDLTYQIVGIKAANALVETPMRRWLKIFGPVDQDFELSSLYDDSAQVVASRTFNRNIQDPAFLSLIERVLGHITNRLTEQSLT